LAQIWRFFALTLPFGDHYGDKGFAMEAFWDSLLDVNSLTRAGGAGKKIQRACLRRE